MDRLSFRLSLAIIAVLLSVTDVSAQWNFDVTSIEAYIQDHKDERSMLLARSTLEASNKLLHELVSEEADDYRAVNIDLNRYTRAFDIIDLLYGSLQTVINVKTTYENVRDRLDGFRTMLDKYNARILERDRIESADTALLHIMERGITAISYDVTALYRSFSDLVLYASGAAACSTADLMKVVGSINGCLDTIEKHVNRTYYEAWRFIELRTGYWKRSVYRSKTKREMAESAIERWLERSRLTDY